MLIPFLHENPQMAASWVPNSYVTKLVSEAYQMMAAATGVAKGYANHPYTRWIAHSEWAWDWLMSFTEALATREYPMRYPDKVRERKRKGISEHHASWTKIVQEIHKPDHFEVHTKEDTPVCPLPKISVANNADTHAERAAQFRVHHATHKNKDMWQFLWEPRARRPDWMPARTDVQEQIVKRARKKYEF